MQLPDPPYRSSAPQHARRASRMERGELAGLEGERLGGSGPGDERGDVRLHVVEVSRRARLLRDSPLLGQARAARNSCDRLDLVRRLAVGLKARPMLEETDAVLLPALILERRANQARPERDA